MEILFNTEQTQLCVMMLLAAQKSSSTQESLFNNPQTSIHLYYTQQTCLKTVWNKNQPILRFLLIGVSAALIAHFIVQLINGCLLLGNKCLLSKYFFKWDQLSVETCFRH